MALKQAKIEAPKTTTAKRSGEVIEIDGKICARRNQIVAEIKTLEFELANNIDPKLKQAGMEHLFSVNRGTTAPIASVKLIDSAEQVVCLSFTSKYSLADAETADNAFTALGRDVNNYVVETAKAAFDQKFFLDAEGNFDQLAYDAVNAAMEAVAAKLKKSNPLSYKKVVLPKPDFHNRRFREFTPAENLQLSEALPNTVTLKEAKL